MSDHHDDAARRDHRRRRAETVAQDLRAIADDVGGFLLVHSSVTDRYSFEPGDLPDTTRYAPAAGWSEAIADPDVVLVWANPPRRNGSRPDTEVFGRNGIELGHFYFSGNYAGAVLQRPDGTRTRYRRGEPFRVRGELLRIKCRDSDDVVIDETNHGNYLRNEGTIDALESLLAHYGHGSHFQLHPVTAVISDQLDRDRILEVLTTARILNPGPTVINGQEWP